MSNMNHTILMSNGQYFDFINPERSCITIETVAHALARICRFTGHTRSFYSVAQHSVYVSHLVPHEDQLAGLLHDAAEAFIGDVSKPLKTLLPDYAAIEARVEAAVFAAFGLPAQLPKSVKNADLVMLLTEARDLMPAHDNAEWARSLGVTPQPPWADCWAPEQAEREFLKRYAELESKQTDMFAAVAA